MTANPAKQPSSEDPWEDCTFEGSERATLRAGAKLSFSQTIAWLEEMHLLSLKFQETRRKMGLRTIYPDGRIEN